MLALIILVGLLSAMLVVTIGVAYRALPSGRMCPRCGGPTDGVTGQRFQRLVAKWLLSRWCSRCGWEGTGRNGPDVAPFEAPVDHDSGFRWSNREGRAVPVFWWAAGETPSPPPEVGHPSGFRWKGKTAPGRTVAHPSGFEFGARDGTPPSPTNRGVEPGPGFKFKGQPPN